MRAVDTFLTHDAVRSADGVV